VHPNSLWVIRFARIPAILTEIGFGTHPTEGRNLGTGWYSQKVAQGMANGILKFLHLK
jgi:N-acetylmuramoyl-L-alanine amidase